MNKQKKYKLKRVKRQHSFKKIETIIRKQSRKMQKKKVQKNTNNYMCAQLELRDVPSV